MIFGLIIVLLVLLVVLPLAGWAAWLLLTTALTGLVIGGIARLIVPGRQRIGVLTTIVIGLAGAIAGGIIGRAIGVGHLLTILIELGVAVVVVAAVTGSRHGRIGGSGRRSIDRAF